MSWISSGFIVGFSIAFMFQTWSIRILGRRIDRLGEEYKKLYIKNAMLEFKLRTRGM